jgi:redox-sensitive bicupin YhaK (pirin superfamily)
MAQGSFQRSGSDHQNTFALVELRRSEDRGHARHGWLDTYHTFSFADYFDPRHVSYRTLRVINEDRILPAQGFPSHSHRDMEILTYVIDGELAHRDSMGNSSVIRAGEFQRMSAGRGVTHSEYNSSDQTLLHLLQIWILPEKKGGTPGYEQKKFSAEERTGNLKLVVSPDGRAGSLLIHQDVEIYSGIFKPGQTIEDRISPARYGWIQVVKGMITLNGNILNPGDGASITGGGVLQMSAPLHGSSAEILFFNLG